MLILITTSSPGDSKGLIQGRQGSITLLAGSWIALVIRLEMWFKSPTLVWSRRYYLTLSLASSPTMHETSTAAEFPEFTCGGSPAMAHPSRLPHQSPPPEPPLQQAKLARIQAPASIFRPGEIKLTKISRADFWIATARR